jgi:hypothetical protein
MPQPECFIPRDSGKLRRMNTLLVIVGIIAIILLFVGGFVKAVNFLLWVGIILLILALIGYILGRSRSGRR